MSSTSSSASPKAPARGGRASNTHLAPNNNNSNSNIAKKGVSEISGRMAQVTLGVGAQQTSAPSEAAEGVGKNEAMKLFRVFAAGCVCLNDRSLSLCACVCVWWWWW